MRQPWYESANTYFLSNERVKYSEAPSDDNYHWGLCDIRWAQ